MAQSQGGQAVSQINDTFGRPMFEKQMNPQYEAHEAICKSIGDMAKENKQLKDRIKTLENLQLKEDHLSEIHQENVRLKEQNKRQNELIDSLREMYAKEVKP
jgi:regulator of replication initiation timing